MRRERGYCSVRWTSSRFSISASPLPLQPSALAGDVSCVYDWIAFPGECAGFRRSLVFCNFDIYVH